MSYGQAYHAWTDPQAEWPEIYHHLSYILFRTDSENAEIVGARCPDTLGRIFGESVSDVLELDDEARAYLFEGGHALPPLLVKTALGLGVLDQRYDGHAGIGVYWHIHGRANSMARLINSGVLGSAEGCSYRISRSVADVGDAVRSRDMPSYGVLADAWSVLDAPSAAWARCDERGCMYGRELEKWLGKLAQFAGCTWRSDVADGVAKVKCSRPVLLEALLLCLLTEAYESSTTRQVSGEISALGGIDGEGLALTMTFPVEKLERVQMRVDSLQRHLGWVSELGGISLHVQSVPLRKEGKLAGKTMPEVRITLEWLHDPAVLSTSDLKAKIRFLYEQEE
jgi:hypothetical protein